MFIKDGQLPEDLAAKRKAGITENSPQPEIPEEEKIYEKPLSEYEPEDWYAKYPKPDIMERFSVHLIDTGVFYILFCVIYYFAVPGTVFNPANFIFMYLFAVYTNLANFLTWIPLYLTNGYTPGKYLYKHRVFRMDGEKLTLRDVIVRTLLIKGFCNAASCGIMNIVSIIVAYVRPYTSALHDIAAGTVTVSIKSGKKKEEKRVEFN